MKKEEEPDDFDNDKQVQQWRKERETFQHMIDNSTDLVCHAFGAEKSGHKNLKHFLVHRSVDIPFFCDSFRGKYNNRDFYFCVFEYETSVNTAKDRSGGSDYYFAGVIELEKSYPHTILQPETLARKIEDIFLKSDVDFKNSKKFSRKFHVITKDRATLEYNLYEKDLNKIASHPAAEIEILGKQCYFRNSRKPVSISEAEKFVELAKILLEVF